MGEWVRYKLDQRTDHILVDEAQDTNADQWAIIDALAEEFFSGQSGSRGPWRTLFMVGDYKQAIFSFQGTDPREFERFKVKWQRAQANWSRPPTMPRCAPANFATCRSMPASALRRRFFSWSMR